MSPETVSPKSLLPKRVLVAEPEPVVRDHIATTLQDLGVPHVDTVAGGAQAMYLRADGDAPPIDCVIAERDMAHGNGLELLRAIRLGMVRHLRPDTCVILMASSWTEAALRAANALDANAVLTKPAAADLLPKQIISARQYTVDVDVRRYQNVSLD